MFREIRSRGIPIVLLDHRSSQRVECSVAVDDVHGGELAGRHLVDLGHKRIALINGPTELRQCIDRRTGFLAALDQSGIELAPQNDLEMPAMTMEAGEAAARQLLAHRKKPTAIFCTNDLLGLGAEHAILSAGHRLPEDVAVVGYDDVPFAKMAFVPLTTVRQPAYELGHKGAQLLIEETSGIDHRHQSVVFAPELVIRASTGGSA